MGRSKTVNYVIAAFVCLLFFMLWHVVGAVVFGGKQGDSYLANLFLFAIIVVMWKGIVASLNEKKQGDKGKSPEKAEQQQAEDISSDREGIEKTKIPEKAADKENDRIKTCAESSARDFSSGDNGSHRDEQLFFAFIDAMKPPGEKEFKKVLEKVTLFSTYRLGGNLPKFLSFLDSVSFILYEHEGNRPLSAVRKLVDSSVNNYLTHRGFTLNVMPSICYEDNFLYVCYLVKKLRLKQIAQQKLSSDRQESPMVPLLVLLGVLIFCVVLIIVFKDGGNFQQRSAPTVFHAENTKKEQALRKNSFSDVIDLYNSLIFVVPDFKISFNDFFRKISGSSMEEISRLHSEYLPKYFKYFNQPYEAFKKATGTGYYAEVPHYYNPINASIYRICAANADRLRIYVPSIRKVTWEEFCSYEHAVLTDRDADDLIFWYQNAGLRAKTPSGTDNTVNAEKSSLPKTDKSPQPGSAFHSSHARSRVENWQTVILGHLMLLKIPPTMEVREKGTVIDRAKEIMLELNNMDRNKVRITMQPKGTNANLQSATRLYGRIIIGIDYGDANEYPSVETFSWDQIELLKVFAEEKLKEEAKTYAFEIIEHSAPVLKRIGGRVSLYRDYLRSSSTKGYPSVFVQSYLIFEGDKRIEITLSYRQSEANIWKDDFENVKRNIEFF